MITGGSGTYAATVVEGVLVDGDWGCLRQWGQLKLADCRLLQPHSGCHGCRQSQCTGDSDVYANHWNCLN